MYNHSLFLFYWLSNVAVLYLSSLFLPQDVTLGNWRFNSFESSIYAGFWMTFIVWACWDFAMGRELKLDKKTTMVAFFLVVNIFAVFAVSRFNYFTGLQEINYVGILIVALAATLLQRIARRIVVKKSLYKEWI